MDEGVDEYMMAGVHGDGWIWSIWCTYDKKSLDE